MAMVKIIPANSQDFGVSQAQIVKIASSGLRGQDLADFIKRAGQEFTFLAKKVKFASGEIPVHLIAIGATEFYGPNRNGDGFSEKTCKKYHHTFVKHARFYRNHVNKDTRKSYGIVKLSYYNEPMHRIELLVALNGTKEAADRNGGLVADAEIDKLYRGDDIGVSMACRVPFDVCSVCGNRAKTKQEYCRGIDEGGSCPGGGLMNKIASILDDGTQLFADNPDPCFFDISRVPRPADRIAWVLGEFKEASANDRVISGVELAEMYGIADPLLDEVNISLSVDPDMYKLAQHLISVENSIARNPYSKFNLAFIPEVQPKLNWLSSNAASISDIVAGSAHTKIAMPLEGFLSLTTGQNITDSDLIKSVKQNLSGIYAKMSAGKPLEKLLATATFYKNAGTKSQKFRLWLEKYALDYSLDRPNVEKRIIKAGLYCNKIPGIKSMTLEKCASAVDVISASYAAYKLAMLNSIKDKKNDFNYLCELALRQNCL